MAANSDLPDPLWGRLIEEFASRVADQLAPQLAKIVSESHGPGPWLTTAEAIKYTGLPDGTFRKLAACGKIPSHGGRSRSFSGPRSTRRSCRRPVSPETLAS
jgi:excisionase family DNA binding protein